VGLLKGRYQSIIPEIEINQRTAQGIIMTPNLTFQRPLEEYIAFFERLTARSLPLLEKYVSADVQFNDPFHSVSGIDAMRAVFEKGFADGKQIKFRVSDVAWGRSGHVAYVRWTCSIKAVGQEDFVIEGMSEISFGNNGKIIAHIDHWDSGSQIMARIPVIKWVWALMRSKIAA